MPIELKPKSSAREAAYEETQGLMLFNEDGELTLAGETIADFLSTADFSAVTESEEALPFLSNPDATEDDPYVGLDEAKKKKKKKDDEKDEDDEDFDEDFDEAKKKKKSKKKDDEKDEDDEEIAEVVLPGAVAARLVDADDLTEMFGYYLDQLAENEDPSLQEQATLAVFADYRDVLEGGIDEDSREEVSKLLLSVLSEGVVYDAAEEIDERIMTKGARRKAKKIRNRPKSGSRRAELKKRRRIEGRGAKKMKIGRQHKMRSRRKQSRIKQLARESADGTLVFGLGDGINGAQLRIGLSESPNLEFTDAQLIEFDVLGGNAFECPDEDCGHTAPYFAFIDEAKKKKKKSKAYEDDDFDEDIEDFFEAKKKKAKKKKDADGDDDGSDKDEDFDEAEKKQVKFSTLSKGTKFSFAHLKGGGVKDDGGYYKSGGKKQKVGDANILVVVKENFDGMCPECGELIEDMLDEKGKVPPAFLKHMKKKKGDKDDEGDDDKDDKDDKDKKNKKDKDKKKDEHLAPSQVPGAFAVAAGRPNLSEGHSLAAATLGVMGGRKPVLTEAED